MHERLIGPVCLVEIEAVLLHLPVKGDKPFMVHAWLAALVARIRGKIEHVPHMRSPHPGMPLKALQHVLMINGLIFLGMIAPVRPV